MRILLTTIDGNFYTVEVNSDIEVINLKALCEQETSIPVDQISLYYNGRPITGDSNTLASYSIKDNDIIMVQRTSSVSWILFYKFELNLKFFFNRI